MGASVIATPSLTSAPRVVVFKMVAPAAHPLRPAEVTAALFFVTLVLVPAFLAVICIAMGPSNSACVMAHYATTVLAS